MTPQEVEPGSDLDEQIDELFAAWERYRNYVKRHHRERLAGVMWIRRGGELICFSECVRYTEQVCRLTFDAAGDSFSISEREA